MSEKLLNGKAIYSPKGKAGEYAKYACNFYVGCSNDCDYCYCKRGLLGHAMGAPTPTLKKCFKDENNALAVFRKELDANILELRKHGLFFTFTSDPWLPETKNLTMDAVDYALGRRVPVKMLTKRADFGLPIKWYQYMDRLALGWTLTGMDNLEAKASSNQDRIDCMKYYHRMGFKTFASVEPVIDIEAALQVINNSLGHCDLYKIGLVSGKREYSREDVAQFVAKVNNMVREYNFAYGADVKTYWKDSVPEFLGMSRDEFPEVTMYAHCVGADYNIFQ